MMYHSLNGLGTLFGGMVNLKMIHNYTGIFFGVSLLFAIVMWWKEAGLFSCPEDIEWLKAAGGYLWHVDNVAEVGKYNPGQKMFFLTVAFFGAAMVASGLLIWFPAGYSPFFFIHLYLVTIGAPGSAPAMFTGWVTKAWVKKQHPKWLKEMEKDGTLVVYGESKPAGKRR